MDAQLAKSPSGYLVGDRVTIADIAIWPWVAAWSDIDEFPHVKLWLYKLLERPGFERGRHVPKPHYHLKLNNLSEEELKAKPTGGIQWIQDAMKQDAEA
ncbi:uncharacterized protein BDV17DRAFT_292054 [Aspergillus undulatus]|uniref:uncharacterized protein n=1 Tax=Aspergillus undulatus TaxID=1810928 RepID=UPI003CCD5918